MPLYDRPLAIMYSCTLRCDTEDQCIAHRPMYSGESLT